MAHSTSGGQYIGFKSTIITNLTISMEFLLFLLLFLLVSKFLYLLFLGKIVVEIVLNMVSRIKKVYKHT